MRDSSPTRVLAPPVSIFHSLTDIRVFRQCTCTIHRMRTSSVCRGPYMLETSPTRVLAPPFSIFHSLLPTYVSFYYVHALFTGYKLVPRVGIWSMDPYVQESSPGRV